MKINKHWKGKMICLLMTLVCGCAPADPAIPENQKEEPSETVTFLTEQYYNDKVDQETRWFQELENRYQVRLDIESIPTLIYSDRLAHLVTTDELPSVVMVNATGLESGLVHRAAKADSIWCLDEYIGDYANLTAFIGSDAMNNLKIEGHIYGIPRLRILPRYAGYYRKDWADRLGIGELKTLDDLYDMLYQFTYGDPDGNGLDDTVGLVNCWNQWGNRKWNGMQLLTVLFGGPNGWRYEGTEMVPDFLSEEWMAMLSWFQKLYEQGILNTDFLILNAEQRKYAITNDKTGMIFGVIDDMASLQAELQEINPDAELELLPVLTDTPNGEKRLNASSGNNGMIMFSKGPNGIQDEAKLKRILQFYDDLCTPSGQDLLLHGLENIHYTHEQDGSLKAVLTKEGKTVLGEDMKDIVQILPMWAYQMISIQNSWSNRLQTEVELRSQYLVGDDSEGLFSDTYQEKNIILNEIIRKASVQFIVGEIDEAAYHSACEAWLNEGGQQVVEELTRAYQQYKNIQ